nr:HNH endonuclease [Bacillus cereus]
MEIKVSVLPVFTRISAVPQYRGSAKSKKILFDVHYIKELEYHPKLALEINNLETVCVDCFNKEQGSTFRKKQSK